MPPGRATTQPTGLRPKYLATCTARATSGLRVAASLPSSLGTVDGLLLFDLGLELHPNHHGLRLVPIQTDLEPAEAWWWKCR